MSDFIDLNVFTQDFKLEMKEFQNDLNFLVQDRGNKESKEWWAEWGMFINNSSNNMFLSMPEEIVNFVNELWFNYDSILELRNLNSETYK